jgi:hypothetical protein
MTLAEITARNLKRAFNGADIDLSRVRYVAHLADDDHPSITACGGQWQGWQAPAGLSILFCVPPHDEPRPHVDAIRQCQACLRLLSRVVRGVGS